MRYSGGERGGGEIYGKTSSFLNIYGLKNSKPLVGTEFSNLEEDKHKY